MARYVLLTFEDNKEADNFVEAVKEGMVFVGYGDTHAGYRYDDLKGVSVMGTFFKPTQFCECPKPKVRPGQIPPEEKSVLGEKWGLRICIKCKKPKRGIMQHPKNLLYPELTDPRDKTRKMYLGVREGQADLPPDMN